jgi:hypothetical protein
MKHGKPADGDARVPVKFSLTPLPGEINPDKTEKPNSKG